MEKIGVKMEKIGEIMGRREKIEIFTPEFL